MPSWGEILGELKDSAAQNEGAVDFDGVRRKYLVRLRELTGRDTILYSTAWTTTGSGGPELSITLEDMQAMMEVCRHLDGPDLDLIIHSPGGSPEATASVVRYLREKFTSIRAFVPLAAMSAATMWALACDCIVMGKHSQLGPIDPQLLLPQGAVPAQAIIRQFDRAVRECSSDPSKLPAWLPILQQYGPALLEQCESADALGRQLVAEWLKRYMLADRENAAARADEVAAWFSNYEIHHSHSVGIGRDVLRSLGLKVVHLEDDQALQDAVLSVHHAAIHTFAGTGARKIVENNLGRAFVRVGAPTVTVGLPGPIGPQPSPAGAPPLSPGTPQDDQFRPGQPARQQQPNRQQRRAKQRGKGR